MNLMKEKNNFLSFNVYLSIIGLKNILIDLAK